MIQSSTSEIGKSWAQPVSASLVDCERLPRSKLRSVSGHMRRIAAAIVLGLISSPAFAHKDRILPISSDGTLGALPDAYGPVKFHISNSARNYGELDEVGLSSPHFNITLSQCILSILKDATHVQASGSWSHTPVAPSPYVSLTFFQGEYIPRSPTNEYSSVTFSLLDGRILMGQRSWVPVVGAWRERTIDPAGECLHWQNLGITPKS